LETRLDKATEAQLGHHGEPEKSVSQVLSKTAAKAKNIDYKKDDTMGEQISKAHDEIGDETYEEMLEKEDWDGFTDEEYEMLINQLLEDQHTNAK
jgi:hypothetical protein